MLSFSDYRVPWEALSKPNRVGMDAPNPPALSTHRCLPLARTISIWDEMLPFNNYYHSDSPSFLLDTGPSA